MNRFAALHREIAQCRACPRLVSWREQIGEEKRRAYRDWKYWARPVPGFGDPRASLAIVGLAPGAHGANRTGRMFTGDSSGKFLYAGLFRAGFANQASSEQRGDGLELRGAYIVAALRCVPPDNRPMPDELNRCDRLGCKHPIPGQTGSGDPSSSTFVRPRNRAFAAAGTGGARLLPR